MLKQRPVTYPAIFTVVLLVAPLVATFTGCQAGDGLPDISSKEYRDTISAFYVGLAALQAGDDVRAEQRLIQATQLAPGEPASWANLGVLSLRQRNLDAATERLEKAHSLAPGNSQISFLLGLLESERGRFEQAIADFRKAVELDPQNLKAAYRLAEEIGRQAGEKSEAEIEQLLNKILTAQPDNLAARLELARVYARRNDTDKLRQMVERIGEQAASWPPEAQQQLGALQTAVAGADMRQAATRITFLRNVLLRVPEYRRSLDAIKSPPGEESEPITRFLRLPTPRFTPAAPDESLTFASESLPDTQGNKWGWAGAISLDGDARPATIIANGQAVHLTGGATLPFPGGPSSTPPLPDGILGVDLNYDFKTDLVIAGAGGLRIFRQDNAGTFTDVTSRTTLTSSSTNLPYIGAWAADIDSDGDLDVIAAAVNGPPIVLRNNGDGTFKELRPFTGVSAVRGLLWADLDGDGDPDAAMVDAQGRLHVFINERIGQFRERAVPQNLGNVVAINVVDDNRDGAFDLVALKADGTVDRLSNKAEGKDWDVAEVARWPNAPSGLTADATRLFVADLDNNGSLDLIASAPSGTQVLLSDAQGNFKPLSAPVSAPIFSIADTTGGGRLDLLGISHDGQPVRLANHGAKSYHWQVIRPRAKQAVGDQRINSFGIGGEMEIRSGLLLQKQPISAPVLHFGLGEQTGADVVRIVWPNGSVRAEFDLKADQTIVAEQRLKGSCPFLFAYNGKEMRFVKDCVPWGSALGLRVNDMGTMDVLQTEEWFKIDGDQLVPKDGYYDLRITAELWETYYYDHLELIVVDHPAGTDVFVDERFAIPPVPLAVRTVAEPRPFLHAWDDLGHDVSDIVHDRDGRYLDTFGRGEYQGITRDHYVEVELPEDAPGTGPLWLIGHGWLHPTDASINIAISQGKHSPPQDLSLEVPDGRGGWVVAKRGLGFPAGRNKTVLIDLSNVFKPGAPRRLRLRTNMEVYWDALGWAPGLPDMKIKTERLSPTAADLHYRGYSVINEVGDSSPELPDYNLIEGTTQRWHDLEGYYTRFGDVRELLEKVDDRYVIMNSGDEMALRFLAPPPPPDGWCRDFVLVGDGWIKDGDHNSMYSKTVLPLPRHDKRDYNTPPGRLEDDPVYLRHSKDWQDYHTRYVTPRFFQNTLRTD